MTVITLRGRRAKHVAAALCLVALTVLLAAAPGAAQDAPSDSGSEAPFVESAPVAPESTASTGPVIEHHGPVFDQSGEFLNLSPDKTHRVVMDVADSGESVSAQNRSFASAARFLNMHARHGIDPGRMEFALVVHGAATKDLLSDAAYRERFGVPNPNTDLLGALSDAGVQVLVCGQSLSHRGFSAEELNPAVERALSAMTAHVVLAEEGYALIPF